MMKVRRQKEYTGIESEFGIPSKPSMAQNIGQGMGARSGRSMTLRRHTPPGGGHLVYIDYSAATWST